MFCPLQKQWVKRNEPKQRKSIIPLFDICAGNKDKSDFLDRLAIVAGPNVGFDSQAEAGASFFRYQEKGDHAFAELPSRPKHPKNTEVTLLREQIGSSNFGIDPVSASVQIFSLNQLSQPPTRSETTNFPPYCFRSSGTSANRINTRGPPIF